MLSLTQALTLGLGSGGGGGAPVVAPVLSTPTDVASGAAGGLLTVTTTSGSGTLYWFVSTSATPPTAANLKAGTGATKFGSLAVTATGAQSATVAGLAVSTLYYAHFIHTNGGGDSNIVTGDGFTTAAYPTFASVTGFGDSMMAGSAATVDANRFLNLFTTATGGGTVRNSGIGATVLQNSNDMDGVPRANNGRDRWQAATAGANLSEALLHSYGYNDMRYTGAPATFNATSFENDYNEIIAANIASGYARSKIYLNTPFWVTDFILANSVTPGFAAGTRAQVLDYASACLRVARDWGVRFADVYTATTGRTDLIDADGVHPNNAGHLFYKDLLLAGRILNPRTATSGTLAGGVETLTMPITDPGDSPISYSVRVLDANYVMGSVVTQAGGSFSLTGVADGTYRVMHRANYGDGTSSPWAVSGTAAVTSASGDSAITSLFAGGEQGAWFDPSDITTLFQDTAGTVPVTAAGQSVARINDKSGRGNHATQATAGSRPTYQVDGARGYLLFDGTDDFLVTGTVTPGVSVSQVFAGIRKLSDAATGLVVDLGPAATAFNLINMLAPSASGANSYRFGSAGSGQQVAGTGAFATAPDTSVITGLASVAAPSVQLRRNGSVVETNTASQGTGGYNAGALYIGRRGGTSLPLNGRIYGLVVRFGAALTGTQVSDAEAWMNGKTGAY